MTRLPIRVRLTVVFTAVMALLLTVIGLFLFYRTRSDLDDAINQSLRSRQSALAAYVGGAAGAAAAIPPGETDAQILDRRGAVVATRPEGGGALLSPAETAQGARRPTTVERHERARLLAGPARFRGRRVVAVAAESLAERERALEGLGRALLVGGSVGLLLAAGLGYATAAAALAPVDAIRRRAEGIRRAEPEARVPVPEADDELARLAVTLNHMLARMAAAAEHERSFVANASHELRTPLTALTAELELALRGRGTTGELRAAIRAAIGDARELSRLTSQLLELARIDESRVGRTGDVPLAAEIERAAAQVRAAIAPPGRAVVVEPTDLVVAGDEDAIGRALRNMGDNALVHGAGTIVFGAEVDEDPAWVRVWVRDEGAADGEQLPPELFERFARGPAAGERPGSGLGLALVGAVADHHGGRAALRREDDGRVCVSMTLPRAGAPRPA